MSNVAQTGLSGQLIGNSYTGGILTVGNSSVTSNIRTHDIVIGDNSTKTSKLYIIEPWQSKNPLQLDNGITVSLAEDMLPAAVVKQNILSDLSEKYPEVYLKIGTNPNQITLVKRDVTLEINME